MVHAFVTITVETAVEATADQIRGVEAVETAHVVAGDVDVIAQLEAEETYQAMTAVADGIRGIDAVADTTTYIALD